MVRSDVLDVRTRKEVQTVKRINIEGLLPCTYYQIDLQQNTEPRQLISLGWSQPKTFIVKTSEAG